METKSPALERPRAVEMAAAVLMFTPVLDLIMMQRTGVAVLNWVGWVSVFGAGLTLMIRPKLSWVLGMILCGIFVISTLVSLFKGFGVVDPAISTARVLDCLLVLFIVGTVFSFFRYPYLDRRQNWFAPTGDRFVVVTPVVLNGKVNGETVDLSYTGARISVPEGVESFKKDQVLTLVLSEINDIQCKAKVIDVKDKVLRIHFDGLSSSEKDLLRQWLGSQNLQKT